MVRLDQILDLDELKDLVSEGYIREQHHPSLPYAILNYTNRTQAARAWNSLTMTCRGLVYNIETSEVIARPFKKFFNHGEQPKQHRRWQSDEMVVVTDKMDGSLGITYVDTTGRPAIATRGSFTSDQAQYATWLLTIKYPEWHPPKGKTVLFEIVYPENRIVVDYGDTSDLILLGMVDIESGVTYGPQAVSDWPGPRAEIFPYVNLRDALSAPPRVNAEGLVVHFVSSDERIKLKQEDYVELHRIVTGLDERVVWDYLSNGRDLRELEALLPEEFGPWITRTKYNLYAEYALMDMHVFDNWDALARFEYTRDRKTFAQAISNLEPWLKACLFLQLDSRLFDRIIWRQIKPNANTNPSIARGLAQVAQGEVKRIDWVSGKEGS